ncbi:hypothetical protein SODALDRAFT_147509 [Sodiomyces alkalinus F11]|uniref:Uncharacterized protein n=1 Tax=Sodiomyces alkalinus (strain CBS 110278 / VKM F-3762 / F11) TaxID=1314773 RepID=A0A3N2PWI2_SODAK|nr:hypothetical protein SODALDRAFT_147509 [Sodiomyces alkalinus F11]ROT38889.1 hypothetical protein SODALDRAFT_147509 [Sodiomyces alkalinus F11]
MAVSVDTIVGSPEQGGLARRPDGTLRSAVFVSDYTLAAIFADSRMHTIRPSQVLRLSKDGKDRRRKKRERQRRGFTTRDIFGKFSTCGQIKRVFSAHRQAPGRVNSCSDFYLPLLPLLRDYDLITCSTMEDCASFVDIRHSAHASTKESLSRIIHQPVLLLCRPALLWDVGSYPPGNC